MATTDITETSAVKGAAAGSTRLAAIQEIETLRRQYAWATDKLGQPSESSRAEGSAIYHQIFTPDATIRTSGGDDEPFVATGPDGWAEVVVGALSVYAATQHLIGTQLVEIQRLEADADGNVTAGDATMTSYLQAWHARPDDQVWIFIGTYYDKVRFVPGKGWQIHEMTLDQVSRDFRKLGTSAP